MNNRKIELNEDGSNGNSLLTYQSSHRRHERGIYLENIELNV